MNEFWNNIVRYPRFFISSLAGLILVIITPIKNLFKVRKLRILLILVLLLSFSALYFILLNMSGF
jgi:Protein of unknown function (DUF751)